MQNGLKPSSAAWSPNNVASNRAATALQSNNVDWEATGRNDLVETVVRDNDLLARVLTKARQEGRLVQDLADNTSAACVQAPESPVVPGRPRGGPARSVTSGALSASGRVAAGARMEAVGGAGGEATNQLHAMARVKADHLSMSRTGGKADNIEATLEVDDKVTAAMYGALQALVEGGLLANMKVNAQGKKSKTGSIPTNLNDAVITPPKRVSKSEALRALSIIGNAMVCLGQRERENLFSDCDDPFAIIQKCVMATADCAKVYHGRETCERQPETDLIMAALCALDFLYGWENFVETAGTPSEWCPPGAWYFAKNSLASPAGSDDTILAVTGTPYEWAKVYGTFRYQAAMAHAGIPTGVPWAFVAIAGWGKPDYEDVPVKDMSSIKHPVIRNLKLKSAPKMPVQVQRLLAQSLVKIGMSQKGESTLRGDERFLTTRDNYHRVKHDGTSSAGSSYAEVE